MTARSAIASLGIVAATVLGAFLVGLAAHRLLGLGPIGAAAFAGTVIAIVLGWRLAEGLSAFAVAALLADSAEYWSGLELRYLDELALVLMVIATIIRHRGRVDLPSIGLREIGVLLLLGAGILSSVLQGVPAEVWVPALALLSKGFAFFYLVLALRVTPDEVRTIAASFVTVAMIVIAIGVAEFVAPAATEEMLRLPPFAERRGELAVVNSVFTHPVLYGWLSAFLALFAFARFVVLREWWALVAAAALGGASILSGRRTPLVGLAAGMVAAVLQQVTAGTARMRTILTTAAVGALLAIVSWPLLGDFYARTFEDYAAPPAQIAEILGEDPDASVIAPMAPRTALYVASVAVARDHLPLGAGLGRFGSHMSRESYSPLYPAYGLDEVYGLKPDETIAVTDTFWPMVLGETGIVGLAGALLFFALLGAGMWRAAGEGPVGSMRAFTLGAMLVYVDSMIRSLTSPIFVAPPIVYISLGVCAIGLSIARSRATEAPAERVR